MYGANIYPFFLNNFHASSRETFSVIRAAIQSFFDYAFVLAWPTVNLANFLYHYICVFHLSLNLMSELKLHFLDMHAVSIRGTKHHYLGDIAGY